MPRGIVFLRSGEEAGGGGGVAFRNIKCSKSTTTGFASLLTMGQLLKERICSFRSKFFPSRADPISKSHLIKRCQQKFMHVKTTLFSEKCMVGEHLLEQGYFLDL